jgi:CubicO group peptidase (beta-lactamase class C family)
MAVSLDEIVARHGRGHAGLVAGALTGGERRVVARGRATTDTIFEIGSITKVFTALLLARMTQDGRAALDEQPFRGSEITLADLATHTSGLPRLPRAMYGLAIRERRDPYARFTAADLDAAIRSVRVRSRGRFRYSNFGMGLLGHLLALRAGCSYGELVTREICAPLGLRDTFAEVPAAERARFADGHGRRGRPVPHWHLDGLAGAGVLRSTAADLLAFLAFQLDPPDSPLGDAARLTQQPRARRGRLRVGLGWLRLPGRHGAGDVVWHNGGTGGFRSFAGFVPRSGRAAVALSSSARSTDAIGMRLLRARG